MNQNSFMDQLNVFTCVIIGESKFLIRCMDVLLERGHNILGLVSGDADVVKSCEKRAIRVFDNIADMLLLINEYDYLFSIVNDQLISKEYLLKAKYLNINYHYGPLPEYPGTNNPTWAILNNEKHYGVTWHTMNGYVDGGDILVEEAIEIDEDVTTMTLVWLCAEKAYIAFKRLIYQIETQTLSPKPQNIKNRFLYQLSTIPENYGFINWGQNAIDIHRIFRAFDFGPYQNTVACSKVLINDRIYIPRKYKLTDVKSTLPFGKLVRINNEAITIATKDYDYEISDLIGLDGLAVSTMNLKNCYRNIWIGAINDDLQVLMKNILSSKKVYDRYWESIINNSNSKSGIDNFDICYPPSRTIVSFQELDILKDQGDVENIDTNDVILGFVIWCGITGASPNISFDYFDISNIRHSIDSNGFITAGMPINFSIDEHSGLSHMKSLFIENLKLAQSRFPFDGSHHVRLITRDRKVPFAVVLGEYSDALERWFSDNYHYKLVIFIGMMDITFLNYCGNKQLSKYRNNKDACITDPVLKDQDHILSSIINVLKQYHNNFDAINLLNNSDLNSYGSIVLGEKTADKFKSVIMQLDEIAYIYPDVIAVAYKSRYLSYSQLVKEIDIFATKLEHVFVISSYDKKIIVSYMERSYEFILLMLSVMRLGWIFLPIDPRNPKFRVEEILRDASVFGVVTQDLLIDFNYSKVNYTFKQINELVLDHKQIHPNPIVPDQLAYIIYTSGSTGKPKGVTVNHASLANVIVSQVKILELNAGVNVAHCSCVGFDAAFSEIFTALTSGSTLYICDEATKMNPKLLVEFIRSNNINLLQITPTLLGELSDYNLPELYKLIVYGEKSAQKILERWGQTRELINAYGPSEATICTSMKRNLQLDNVDNIGTPVDNVNVYVVNKYYKIVPILFVGQIVITGKNICAGYMDNTQNSGHFIKNIFDDSSEFAYLTGDKGFINSDREIIYVDRMDLQFNFRGFRVEPEEISQAIKSYPLVESVVVVQSNANTPMAKLMAYVKFDDSAILEEKVNQWRKLFDKIKFDNNLDKFSINGWVNTYTRKGYNQIEMEDWANNITNRIRTLKPKKILDLGCGSGVILQSLVEDIDLYVGLDISESAISHLQTKYLNKNYVKLYCLDVLALDSIGEVIGTEFDCVVVNSVIQYFPSIDYLNEFLHKCLLKIKTQYLFIGDVRDLRSQKDFYKSLENDELKIDLLMQNESELLVSPYYFLNLKTQYPNIKNILPLGKESCLTNEMSAFRYDVIITLCQEDNYVATPIGQLKSIEFSGKQSIDAMLNQQQDVFIIKRLPNIHICRLCDKKIFSEEVFEQAKNLIQNKQIIQSFAYDAIPLLCLDNNNDDFFYLDVLIYKGIDSKEIYSRFTQELIVTADNFSNHPHVQVNQNERLREIKEYLKSLLPPYMIPQEIHQINKVGTTMSGKLDKNLQPVSSISANSGVIDDAIQLETIGLLNKIFNIDSVDINQDFFQAGGDSLSAIQFISEIMKKFNIDLDINQIFDASSISQIIETIRMEYKK